MSQQNDNGQSETEERTELAEERTEWADQRTFLAQERTFAGWIRTGLTSIAVGLGVIELLREVQPEWLISTIGFIFIVVGGILQVLAFLSYRNVNMEMKRSSRPDMSISMWWIGAVTGGLVICAIAGLVLVFGGTG